jgi:beta-glucosidase
MEGTMEMKSDFIWGAATASIQIEGGAHEDGKSLSNWDVFCEIPGKVADGDHALTASDHYHHMKEDVKLMKELGLKAYRFSISWPRIIPEGVGTVNQAGLLFYSQLVDELLANDIEPYVTLFHWDLPYSLHIRGGWLNPDMPNWICEYTSVVVDALSDRVSHWVTLNEPQCFINNGYFLQSHAPGYKSSDRELALAVHHVLLAHGKMVSTIRQISRRPCKVAFSQSTPYVSIPYTQSAEDIDAARRRQFSLPSAFAGSAVIYTDPIHLGHYPAEYLERYASVLPKFGNDDMKIISQPVDYFGINLYNGDYVKAGTDGNPVVVPRIPGYAHTAFGWTVSPEIMYWTLKFCYERYQTPIIITENGMSATDWIHLDGHVHDMERIDFMHRYLYHMKKAIADGVDIRGYFAWTLLDNFEWARGYYERFGLIYVDYPTGKRTIKDSGYWYRDTIKSNGANL